MSVIYQKPPQNYQYYVGQSNLVNSRTDQVITTAPQTNAVLHGNIVVPARTLVQDGQILWYYGAGSAGAHAGSTLTFEVNINTTQMFVGTSAASAVAHTWEILLRFAATNIGSGTTLMFGWYFTGGAQFSPNALATTVQSARFSTPVFGGPGFGVNVDNVFQVRTTDAAGAEIIAQDITQVWIQ